jgi:hypothetical protein
MHRRQQKCYCNMSFIFQAAKMKSWLLILGGAITILNHVVYAAAESKLLNVSQYEHFIHYFTTYTTCFGLIRPS